MTRRECLEKAMSCVLQDRAGQYGGLEDNFRTIASFWSVYLGRKICPADVAAMMALLKVARLRANHTHADSWVDLAGYAACGAECAVHEAGEDRRRLREQEAEFKPGDRLILTTPDGEKRSCFFICESGEADGICRVLYSDGTMDGSVPLDALELAPKAEGYESLIILPPDAPQTPDELCQRIVDCNPATFRTPTGEELAEMAREKEDGDGA